jgi:hypothetical protein
MYVVPYVGLDKGQNELVGFCPPIFGSEPGQKIILTITKREDLLAIHVALGKAIVNKL